MRTSSILALFGAVLPALAQNLPLSTSGRWIVDADGQRVKLRCVNWAGHLETNVPEGLNKQSIDYIADFISEQGFNCVRLTYSIDHARFPDVTVGESFRAGASAAGVDVQALDSAFGQLVEKNAFAADATVRQVYEAVIAALWKRNVMTIMDNHLSKASWCCNIDDGNGWWDEGFGYNSANSRFFNTQEWLESLSSMATWSISQPGVIGMGLRNEVREFLLQGLDGRNDWYNYMDQGARRVHEANPELLILIGGTQSSTDLVHLRAGRQLDFSPWVGKHVWEWHAYEFTVTFAVFKGSCDAIKEAYGLFAGFVLAPDEAYTAPLILSEFGFSQVGGPNRGLSDAEKAYFDCLGDYLVGNDGDWALWAIMGSYYVREGTVDYNESFGVLDFTWSGLRNPELPDLLAPLFQVTQGP